MPPSPSPRSHAPRGAAGYPPPTTHSPASSYGHRGAVISRDVSHGAGTGTPQDGQDACSSPVGSSQRRAARCPRSHPRPQTHSSPAHRSQPTRSPTRDIAPICAACRRCGDTLAAGTVLVHAPTAPRLPPRMSSPPLHHGPNPLSTEQSKGLLLIFVKPLIRRLSSHGDGGDVAAGRGGTSQLISNPPSFFLRCSAPPGAGADFAWRGSEWMPTPGARDSCAAHKTRGFSSAAEKLKNK